MNHKTHRNVAKFLNPNIPFKKIDKINSAIDSPNKQMKALQQTGMFSKTQLDAFGLSNHGHRKYNHGVDSAFFSAYMVDPENALDLAMLHLALDKMGNYLHDTVGGNEKDLFEASLNKFIDMYRVTNQGYNPRRRKQMFY